MTSLMFKTVLCLSFMALTGLWVTAVNANGDGPAGKLKNPPHPATREIGSQAVSVAPFSTGSLSWDYVVGAPPNDGVPTKFFVRCARAGGARTITNEAPATGTAPTLRGKIRLNALLPSAGTYDCIQVPWNVEVGEGPPSVAFPFVATSGTFVAPVNSRLE